MEGEDAADHHARASQQLYEGFKEILESDVPMSDEMCAAVKFGMNHPQATKCLIYLFSKTISNSPDNLIIFCFFSMGTTFLLL